MVIQDTRSVQRRMQELIEEGRTVRDPQRLQEIREEYKRLLNRTGINEYGSVAETGRFTTVGDKYGYGGSEVKDVAPAGTTRTAPSTPTATTTSVPTPPRQAIQDVLQSGNQYDPRIEEWLNRIQQATLAGPITASDVMASPIFQELRGSQQTYLEDEMRRIRARLAAAGTLGPESSPAAAQLGGAQAQAAAALASQVPGLVQLSQGIQQQRLGNMQQYLEGLRGLKGQEFEQALAGFQATAPYQWFTPAQAAQLALQEAGVTGEYYGQPTLAARGQEANIDLQRAGLLGTLEGQPTLQLRELLNRISQQSDSGTTPGATGTTGGTANIPGTVSERYTAAYNQLAGEIAARKAEGASLDDIEAYLISRAGQLGIPVNDAIELARSVYQGFPVDADSGLGLDTLLGGG